MRSRRFICRLLAIIAASSVLLAHGTAAHAVIGEATATIQANPDILLADGRSKATLTATLDDGSGHAVSDGTQVHFTTNLGTLNPNVAIVAGGVARTTLISSPTAGVATVTASFVSSVGGASGNVSVEFTTDTELANTDQVVANWIRITSSDYLAYCADSRTVDAAGHKRGVRIAYRGTTIDASAAQVDLDSNLVRAQDAVIKHGVHPPLHVDSLVYYLDSHQGTGMIANAPGQHTVEQVSIDGNTLATQPLKPAAGDRDADYDFQDLSSGHVLITATSISVQPHQRIQLSRATIYIDRKKIVSMANQVMPLATDQIFGQQVLGYGTNGLFLDVPYYTSLTPTTTGMFSLRSQAASIDAGTYYSGRSALALDYDRSYTDGNRQGDMKVIGLSSGNWGLRWTQSQRIWGNTQTYFYLDSPEHQSLYGSASLRHDFGAVALDVQTSEQSPFSQVGSVTAGAQSVNVDLQTPSHMLIGRHNFGLLYSEEANYSYSASQYKFSNASIDTESATRSYGVRFDTPPIIPNKQTSITDSFSLDQTYSQADNFSALNLSGNVQINSRLSQTLSTNFTYNYTHTPQLGAPIPLVVNNQFLSLINAVDQHSFSFMINANSPNDLWESSLSTSLGLPTGDTTVGGNITYRVSSQMHLGLSNYYSEFAGYAYRDYDVSLSHRIGTRDIAVSWSALEHRWQLKFGNRAVLGILELLRTVSELSSEFRFTA